MAKDPFWSQVNEAGDCKLWTGPGYGAEGYGLFKANGEMRLAHRVAWEEDQGAPPQGALRQTCGNKRCVARPHLEPVPPAKPRRRLK